MGTRDRLLAPLRRSAPPDATAQALAAAFGAEALTPSLFAPELLGHVPLDRLQETVSVLCERHGALRSVRRQRDLHQLTFTHGTELVWAATDAEGRLTTLVTGPGAILARNEAPAVPGPARSSRPVRAPRPAGATATATTAADRPAAPPAPRNAEPSGLPGMPPMPDYPPAVPALPPGRGPATTQDRPARPQLQRPPLAPAAAVLQRTVIGYAAATAAELTIPYLTDTATGWTLLLLQTPAFAWFVLRTAPAHTLPPWFRLLPLLPVAAALLAGARALPLLGPGLPWTTPGLPEIALFCSMLGLAGWTHRRIQPVRPSPTAHPLTLGSPLRGGCFALAEGGGPAVNRHAEDSLQPGGARHQRYAVDLVQLGEGAQWRGRRALGLAPASNERYAIHGHPVLSPCDGVVVTAVDGLPDHEPYRSGTDHPEGNHIAIDTGRALVVLSWLRQDSIRVRRGQHLTAGTLIAAVGNSGAGTEPALHLRAETRSTNPTPGAGAGMPFRLTELRGELLRGRRFTVPD